MLRYWLGEFRDTLRRWEPGAAEYLALLLVAVAVVAIVMWDHHKLRAWTPNIAVSAFSLAITVSVVSWIVGREARVRIRPRVESTRYWIGLGLRGLVSTVITDYAETHKMTFRPIPVTAPEMFDLWLEDRVHEDVPRVLLEGAEYPMLIAEAREYMQHLEEYRARNLDVLEHDLIQAIDDFGSSVAFAVGAIDSSRQPPQEPAPYSPKELEDSALYTAVMGAQIFAKVFEKYDPKWMSIPTNVRLSAIRHGQLIATERSTKD